MRHWVGVKTPSCVLVQLLEVLQRMAASTELPSKSSQECGEELYCMLTRIAFMTQYGVNQYASLAIICLLGKVQILLNSQESYEIFNNYPTLLISFFSSSRL